MIIPPKFLEIVKNAEVRTPCPHPIKEMTYYVKALTILPNLWYFFK